MKTPIQDVLEPSQTRRRPLLGYLVALVMTAIAFLSVYAPYSGSVPVITASALIVLFRVGTGHRLEAPDWIAVAYLLLAILSLGWTDASDLTAAGLLNTGACVTVFIAVRAVTSRTVDYSLVSIGLIAGALASLWVMARVNGGLRWLYDDNAGRVGVEGININHTAYSFVAAVVVILTLAEHARKTGRWRLRLLILAFCALMYSGIILTGTRGALLSLVLVGMWWPVYRLGPRFFYSLLILAFTVANLFVLFGWADDIVLGSRWWSIERDAGDLSGRLATWPVAREAFWGSPIVGNGVGSFQAYPGNVLHIGAHSAVLDVGAGLGIIGIALYLGVFRAALRPAGRAPGGRDRILISGTFVAAMAPILLSGYWHDAIALWITMALVSRSMSRSSSALGGIRHD